MKTNKKPLNLISSCRVSLVSLCTAVLLSSLTALATGPGSGGGTDGNGFAMQEMAKNSGLSVYEQYIKAFEESANNKINLEWKPNIVLDGDVVFSEVTKLIKHSSDTSNDTVSIFYVKYKKLEQFSGQGHITLSRELIPNPFGQPDYKNTHLTITVDGAAILTSNGNDYLLSHLDTSTSTNSLVTTEDYYGSKWEVRQYDEKTVIFVQYPNKDNKCGSRLENPQNGYCMIGTIFNNRQ